MQLALHQMLLSMGLSVKVDPHASAEVPAAGPLGWCRAASCAALKKIDGSAGLARRKPQ
jgi:hypothetical protein